MSAVLLIEQLIIACYNLQRFTGTDDVRVSCTVGTSIDTY